MGKFNMERKKILWMSNLPLPEIWMTGAHFNPIKNFKGEKRLLTIKRKTPTAAKRLKLIFSTR